MIETFAKEVEKEINWPVSLARSSHYELLFKPSYPKVEVILHFPFLKERRENKAYFLNWLNLVKGQKREIKFFLKKIKKYPFKLFYSLTKNNVLLNFPSLYLDTNFPQQSKDIILFLERMKKIFGKTLDRDYYVKEEDFFSRPSFYEKGGKCIFLPSIVLSKGILRNSKNFREFKKAFKEEIKRRLNIWLKAVYGEDFKK